MFILIVFVLYMVTGIILSKLYFFYFGDFGKKKKIKRHEKIEGEKIESEK